MRSKALLSLVAAVLLAGAPALADNDVGCGVGTTVWEGQSGLFPKLCASFTNGMTFQSVSITFGILGCDGRGTVTADAELRRFAAANIDRLARDVARGEGETLDALGHLLQVPEVERPDFARFAQAHFLSLFPTAETQSNDMVDALYRIIEDQAVQG
ncbi:MAG: DUF3015 family protein [Myxococcota bacterium]|nr:DUF3015 family protein [Myxococcota bacterium]